VPVFSEQEADIRISLISYIERFFDTASNIGREFWAIKL
jgi:hypothetical protein